MAKRWSLRMLMISIAVTACDRRHKDEGKPTSQAYNLETANFPLDRVPWSPALQAEAAQSLAETFGRFIPPRVNRAQMEAISACQPCLASVGGELLQSFVAGRGAVPQILVPQVREKVKSDGTLKTLGDLGIFGDALKSLFATDESITTKIRAGVNDNLMSVFPNANLTRDMPNFYFDGMVASGDQATGVSRVNAADLAAKWLVVASVPNMWQGMAPVRFSHHGLQLLNFAGMISDWNYIYGLQSDENHKPYGGIAIDARDGITSPIRSMDPRKDSKAAGVFSGDYAITLPNAHTLLDLVMNGRESWARAAEPVPLGEQALIWRAAAQAFHFLRPRASIKVAAIFDDKRGMLPREATVVPLVFLPGLAYMLDGPFVNDDKRLIYGEALVPDSQRREASLQDKDALGRAVGMWANELVNLSDVANNPIYVPSQDLLKQIREGSDRLRLGAQFVVQNILARHVVIGQEGRNGLSSIVLTEGTNMASLKVTAETLTTLIELERQYPSPLVRNRIEGLFHWFMGKMLTPRMAPGQAPLSVEEAVWTYNALSAYGALTPESARAPWLSGALTVFGDAIGRWGVSG